MDVGDLVVIKRLGQSYYYPPFLFIVDVDITEEGKKIFTTCAPIYHSQHVSAHSSLKATGSYCENDLLSLADYLKIFGNEDLREETEKLLKLIKENFDYEYSKH